MRAFDERKDHQRPFGRRHCYAFVDRWDRVDTRRCNGGRRPGDPVTPHEFVAFAPRWETLNEAIALEGRAPPPNRFLAPPCILGLSERDPEQREHDAHD